MKRRGFFPISAILALLVTTAAPAGPTKAERAWLKEFLETRSDREAERLLRKYPGGKPSPARVKALLAAGFRRESLEPGMHHTTLESQGETWKFTVSIPRGYDGKKTFPVVIDAGHMSFRKAKDDKAAGALANYLRQVPDPVVGVRPRFFDKLAVDGRYDRLGKQGGGERNRLAAALFRDLLRTLRVRYAVDPDRIYITGISMSGFWAWRLGADLPGEFAGIVPISSVTWQVAFGFENFRALPVFILHAKDDRTCFFSQAGTALERLQALGAPVGHHFLERGGHIMPFNHFRKAWKWISGKKRDTTPREIHLRLQRSGLGPVHWIEVVELNKGARFQADKPTADLDARIGEKNVIEVTTRNVKRFRVHLGPDLVDFTKAVKVKVNGKTVHHRHVKPTGQEALEEARRRRDTGVFYPVVIRVGR